jgi:hypothetical protein
VCICSCAARPVRANLTASCTSAQPDGLTIDWPSTPRKCASKSARCGLRIKIHGILCGFRRTSSSMRWLPHRDQSELKSIRFEGDQFDQFKAHWEKTWRGCVEGYLATTHVYAATIDAPNEPMRIETALLVETALQISLVHSLNLSGAWSKRAPATSTWLGRIERLSRLPDIPQIQVDGLPPEVTAPCQRALEALARGFIPSEQALREQLKKCRNP